MFMILSSWLVVSRWQSGDIAPPLHPPEHPIVAPLLPWGLGATPLRAWACLTDTQRPPFQRGPIQSSNRRRGLHGVWHLDKAEAAQAARRPIQGDRDALHCPIGLERLAQPLMGGGVRKIPNKNLHGSLPHGWSCLDASATIEPPSATRGGRRVTPAAAAPDAGKVPPAREPHSPSPSVPPARSR